MHLYLGCPIIYNLLYSSVIRYIYRWDITSSELQRCSTENSNVYYLFCHVHYMLSVLHVLILKWNMWITHIFRMKKICMCFTHLLYMIEKIGYTFIILFITITHYSFYNVQMYYFYYKYTFSYMLTHHVMFTANILIHVTCYKMCTTHTFLCMDMELYV